MIFPRRLKVYKQYLLWALKYINMTYIGLFGAPGFSFNNQRHAVIHCALQVKHAFSTLFRCSFSFDTFETSGYSGSVPKSLPNQSVPYIQSLDILLCSCMPVFCVAVSMSPEPAETGNIAAAGNCLTWSDTQHAETPEGSSMSQ